MFFATRCDMAHGINSLRRESVLFEQPVASHLCPGGGKGGRPSSSSGIFNCRNCHATTTVPASWRMSPPPRPVMQPKPSSNLFVS